MGGSNWRDNFNPSNFWPTYHEPELFVASQWQSDKYSPNLLYLIAKCAIFIAFFIIWILTYTMEDAAGKPRWPVFLTNWGMTLCMLQSFLSCLMVTCAYFGKQVFDKPELVDTVMALYKTYWVINSMATTLAFTITLVYWSIIYAATGYYWSTMNFMVHGFNSVLMFFDFCIVANPVRLLHFIYPVLISLAYVTMTAIFYACGGTMKDGKTRDIYPILKWGQPVMTILVCCGVLIVMGVMHLVTFGLYKGKMKIAELCMPTSANSNEYNAPSNVYNL